VPFTTHTGEPSRIRMPVKRADRDYLLSRWLARLRRHVDAAKREVQSAFPHLIIDDGYYVLSLAGQATQPPHIDARRTPELRALCRRQPEHAPLSVFVSAQHGTRLRIWPRTHRLLEKEPSEMSDHDEEEYSWCDVTIPPGHMLIIRYDLLHAGVAYARPNVLAHLYASTPLMDDESSVVGVEPLAAMPLCVMRRCVVN